MFGIGKKSKLEDDKGALRSWRIKGIWQRRSKVSSRAIMRSVVSQGMGPEARARLDPPDTPQRQRELTNWQRSKVGKATLRRRRRMQAGLAALKTADRIREEIADRRAARQARRAAEALEDAGWTVEEIE